MRQGDLDIINLLTQVRAATTGGGAPTGSAGGDLTGTYPNPTVKTSVSLTTPLLGTPTSGTLTNCTGLPVSSGVSGLGTGVATLLATPSSANLRSALTDENGTGVALFDSPTNPTLVGATLTGQLLNSTASLVSAPAHTLTGAWFSGGTATTTKPHFLVEVSGATSTAWNTGGTGLGVNAASGFAGHLLNLQVNGSGKFSVDSTGTLVTGSAITAGGNITASATGGLFMSGRSRFTSSADGNMTVANNAGSAFSLFMLGGATASFPAIKRNAATMEDRLADDSGFAARQSLYDRFGSGSPEGAVTAPVGAVYHRTDGGAGTSNYFKESGAGNTGWVGK